LKNRLLSSQRFFSISGAAVSAFSFIDSKRAAATSSGRRSSGTSISSRAASARISPSRSFSMSS